MKLPHDELSALIDPIPTFLLLFRRRWSVILRLVGMTKKRSHKCLQDLSAEWAVIIDKLTVNTLNNNRLL
jgi:hypothetical protein